MSMPVAVSELISFSHFGHLPCIEIPLFLNRIHIVHHPTVTALETSQAGLTPELSRAERDGWEPVLPACPEVSTKRRYGVGLNDLLGGPDACEGEAMANLPKTEAWMPERAPRTLSRPSPKQPYLERTNRPQANHCHRSLQARRMQRVSAPDERDRSANAPRTCPKSNADRSR